MKQFTEDLDLDTTDLRILDQLQTDASLSNQALAERVHVSPPTCLRRVKRLLDAGLIERQVAVLNADQLQPLIGHGLTAIVEVMLTEQNAEALAAFEARIAVHDAVQQCYRVSPGPDFVLIVYVRDMPAYQAFAQQCLSADVLVRNVKTYFNLQRSKFSPRIALF
jgi:Lrp/AsnC family transcriptional regulator, leucine-responsive regulatory protein